MWTCLWGRKGCRAADSFTCQLILSLGLDGQNGGYTDTIQCVLIGILLDAIYKEDNECFIA